MNEVPVLGDCLKRLGWSPDKLAREINRVRPNSISPKAPYGWLKGSTPRGSLPQIVAAVLSHHLRETITTEALWPTKAIAPGADGWLQQPWSQEGTWEGLESFTVGPLRSGLGVSRPLSGQGLIGPAVDWLTTPDAPVGGRPIGEVISPQAIDVLTDRVTQLRRLDDAQGGPLVLDWITQDLNWAAYLARNGSYDPLTGQRLHSVLAELAQLAGWLACDLGRNALGQRYLLFGLRAAHTANNRALGANIVSCLSYQATWRNAHEEALHLIKISRQGVGGPAGGVVHALLATRQARAHAQLGRLDDCARALDEVAALIESTADSAAPSWAYWVTPAVLAADAGRAWLELDRPEVAEHHLLRGLQLFGDAQPRNRLLHTMSLAEARLRQRDLDGAAVAARRALALRPSLDSGRARRRMAGLRDEFERSASPLARDVTDEIGAALTA
ncbi:hypothetical protein [Kitasatospora sp. NPDC088134]|uniref:hypothetical protein n=1 Tax=Kitasatospora sp. NPDC088134 TaxID=3364071 RepID=UPI00380A772E